MSATILPRIGVRKPSAGQNPYFTDIDAALQAIDDAGAEIYVPCVTDGVTSNTALLQAAITAAAPGDTLRLPRGPILTGALTCPKCVRIVGAGQHQTRLVASAALTAPIITFTGATAPAEGIFNYYGAGLRSLALIPNSGPGVQVGPTGGDGTLAGWTWLDDIRIEGGTISVDSKSTNTKITNCHFLNPTSRFVKATDIGLELRMWDCVLEVSPSFTVPKAIEIAVATGGIKGAVYLRDVALNNGGTCAGGVEVSCPNGSTASMPLRATNCTWDNLTGPAYNLINVTDAQIMGGWANSAGAGSHGAIRFYGGGNHVVMGVEQLNGGSGGSGCTFDFAGGATGYVSLIANRPATEPLYRITGTAPANLLILDLAAVGIAIGNVTNNEAALIAAMAKNWTPTVLDYLLVTKHIQASGPIRPGNYTTAGRPSAVTYGPGATICDTTLGTMCWSDGTNWRRYDTSAIV